MPLQYPYTFCILCLRWKGPFMWGQVSSVLSVLSVSTGVDSVPAVVLAVGS